MNRTSVEILKDSLIDGERVTTFQVVFPRIVAEELLRHRSFSFCSASSRAIPINRMISDTVNFFPKKWRLHRSGMQPLEDEMGIGLYLECNEIWERGMKSAIETARALQEKGIAKELANRVLVPYQYITIIISGSKNAYGNFFLLRNHSDAQFEIRVLAQEMQRRYNNSVPQERSFHLPFVNGEVYTLNDIKVSVARSARLSYTTVDGSAPSFEKDLLLYNKLLESRHLSPFEFQVFSRSETNKILGNSEWRRIAFKENKKCCDESLNDFGGNLGSKKLVQLRKLIEKNLQL